MCMAASIPADTKGSVASSAVPHHTASISSDQKTASWHLAAECRMERLIPNAVLHRINDHLTCIMHFVRTLVTGIGIHPVGPLYFQSQMQRHNL